MSQYKHIFIRDQAIKEKFISPKSGGGSARIPERERGQHSTRLLRKFDQMWREKASQIEERTTQSIPSNTGTYIQFTSALDSDLLTKSLENISNGIRLLNIQEETINDRTQIKASVFVPHGKENYFVEKIKKYRSETVRNTEKPKNAKLVNSIEDVRLALLEGIWTDNKSLIPNETAKWCEAWLNIKDDCVDILVEKFANTLREVEIISKPNYIIFPERAVILIYASRIQLIELMNRSDILAEFRAGQETAGFWMNESRSEQENWADDLLQRLDIDAGSKVKVCILDKGVNNRHQLLSPILADEDNLTVNPTWGTHDHHPDSGGHGTLMAGLVGYGKFEPLLTDGESVLLTHKLCSVKILPPPTHGETPIELWGDITSQGISRAELQNPEKIILFCMAVTSKADTNKGRPSSWSGAIDNLAYGEGENQRLIIICAGNLDGDEAGINYPNSNYLSSIQNPAQSWNSLTVGAYTEKILIHDDRFANYLPIAGENELSPYSTTSLSWEGRWPTKPDVVFEGGNLLRSPDGAVVGHNDLELLSTSKRFNIKPFDVINATSAATAQASWFAAKIACLYPDAWVETIRGLIVHSAVWHNEMYSQMNVRQSNKTDVKNLMRVFGYGVPNLAKALYSSDSALTFITENTIQPFMYKTRDGKATTETETKDIHIFKLPWPEDLLLSLGVLKIRLRITLSYFIQPGAGAIGWKDRYRYASYGLRFDLNNVGEPLSVFKKRINKAAREENEEVKSSSGWDRWMIGSDNRSSGSIHSDFWDGTAAELATCNLIAVYPVNGWWRERKHLKKVENKTRYSLIVSLETEAQGIDIYSAVQAMIETPIEITT
jgi:hypothetical protein